MLGLTQIEAGDHGGSPIIMEKVSCFIRGLIVDFHHDG